MVCQLDLSSAKTNPTAQSTPASSTTPINKNLLSSLSLTLLSTSSTTPVNRRTSSTILNKTNDLIIIKNSISLDNLEQQAQEYHQVEREEKQKERNENNNISSLEYINDNTLINNSLPDLDSLVLNKCYLFNKNKSNLSLSNKNDDNEDDSDDNNNNNNDDNDDVVEDDYFNNDDYEFNIINNNKQIISSSSESSSTSPINDKQQHLSISPSISLSNETKSINSSTFKESTSPLSHEHILVQPIASKVNKSNYLSAEIISLSSLTSNYSQFDFINEPQKQPQEQQQIEIKTKSQNTFSAFFNRFTSNKNKKTVNTTSTTITTTNNRIFGGAFKLFQSSSSSNQSSTDVPSSVLILENRPSNLPAKSTEEALKHKQEYEKMVEIAKKKGLIYW